jgi:hypothetical protein
MKKPPTPPPAIQTFAILDGDRILGETTERLYAERDLLILKRMGYAEAKIEVMPLEEAARRIREQEAKRVAKANGGLSKGEK